MAQGSEDADGSLADNNYLQVKDSFCGKLQKHSSHQLFSLFVFCNGASCNFTFSLQNSSYKHFTVSAVMKPGNRTLVDHDTHHYQSTTHVRFIAKCETGI